MSQDYFSHEDKTLFNGETPEKLSYDRTTHTLEGATVFNGSEGSAAANGAPGSSRDLPRGNDQHLRAQVQQLHYNNNKVALDRAILSTIELIRDFQAENSERPVFVPVESENPLLNSSRAHLALTRKQSTYGKQKRSAEDETRVLQVIGVIASGTLDKNAIAQLWEDKLQQTATHLQALKTRIDDTSSKVFVTGDLNAGKSTFCNALLRRRVLPEDQQPCTSVFCEVIDFSENNCVEQVHAVPIGSVYDRNDETTFIAFALKELEELVYECEKYSLLKVYVEDRRPRDESLLRNGVVDISVIDAPGLNLDSYQTTEVFSRQEEIDLVVFVVSAENHFTLSCKEFIASAADEKKLMFFVVNKFDQIKDKNRCRNRILEQIQRLSPDTHKDASEFVHFVASEDVGDGEGNGDGDGGDSQPEDADLNSDAFDHLENSLRNFVLKKRSISKLLPAKTYLLKLLDDLEYVSLKNKDIYSVDNGRIQEKLDQLQPEYDRVCSASRSIGNTVDQLVESTVSDCYQFAKKVINKSLDAETAVVYPGIFRLQEFADETREAIISSIVSAVSLAEIHARDTTKTAVDRVVALGNEIGQDLLKDRQFDPSLMYQRRISIKNVNTSLDFVDFVDPSWTGFKDYLWSFVPVSYPHKTVVTTLVATTGGVQLTTVLLYGFRFLSFGMIKRSVVPLAVAGVALVGSYLVSDVARALPLRLMRKVKNQLAEIDYVHANAHRISREVRQVLKFPARAVRESGAKLLEEKTMERQELFKRMDANKASMAVFGNLLERTQRQKSVVQSFDLETVYQVD